MARFPAANVSRQKRLGDSFHNIEKFSKLAWRVSERDPMEISKHSHITSARERGQTKLFQVLDFSETEHTQEASLQFVNLVQGRGRRVVEARRPAFNE